ncbi:hypothetical protein PGB34_20480 [Xenophilus arseniciresistens]|uniref:Uncharacterized protein n=1 Tax=Xenophilus arseniciresistens TaxID=1283306 RepID=A0AAE3T103_9BURK|nr:hypothetical protein [Xenophilus arseniciresistens]MDA7418757.1 hypothetical protein [Xenophilus arseniciresistens]
MHGDSSLWPALAVIRGAFETTPPPGAGDAVVLQGAAAAGSAAGPTALADLLLPLTELARRRDAVAQKGFSARWAPGRLVSVLHDGRLLGVMLDRDLGQGRWRGWMAAAEADWAGPFDVLLEPQDEPFEPLFGLIQTWNTVSLTQAPQLCARVLGELSATRLAALRATADEAAQGQGPAIAPAPGRVALRTVAQCFTVLSGTPLAAEGDPRADYQSLYRGVAASLQAGAAIADAGTRSARTTPPPPAQARMQAPPRAGGWARLWGWLGGDGPWRPALAALALVVVLQNASLLGRLGEDEDAVRFREAPAPAASAAAPDLRVRFKADTALPAAAELLRRAGAEMAGAPDEQGRWPVRLMQPREGRAVLESSPLVEGVDPP